jgi:hypothetical protein
MIRKSILLAGIFLSLISSAAASGDYSNYWISFQGNCRIAKNSKTPLTANSRCTAFVHYDYSACQNGDKLTDCVYYLEEGRSVMYWLERRASSKSRWQRFTTPRVFDRSAVDEKVNFSPIHTYEYRVAFDLWGQKAFGDEFTDSTKIYVK